MIGRRPHDAIYLSTGMSSQCVAVALAAHRFSNESHIVIADRTKTPKELMDEISDDLFNSKKLCQDIELPFKDYPSKKGRNKHHWLKNRRKKK